MVVTMYLSWSWNGEAITLAVVFGDPKASQQLPMNKFAERNGLKTDWLNAKIPVVPISTLIESLVWISSLSTAGAERRMR